MPIPIPNNKLVSENVPPAETETLYEVVISERGLGYEKYKCRSVVQQTTLDANGKKIVRVTLYDVAKEV